MRVCTNATGPVFTSLGSGPTFATNAFALGTAATAGSASTVVRSDATIAVFDTNTATTSAVGDAAATGSIAFAARRDHVHGREAFGTASSSTTFGASATNGSATTISRSDHTHGTPTHVHADHNAIVLNDLASATGAYSMGGFALTNLLDPTTAQGAATKNYVDTTAQGLSPKTSAICATTAALAANTYANGTNGVGATLTASANGVLTIDGVTPGIAFNSAITAVTNSTVTVTATIASTAGLNVGQSITITGITGFATNNPNGVYSVTSVPNATTFTYVVAAAPTGSYSSGGTLTASAQRILVKNEAATANNGIYIQTTLGTASAAYVLTRANDANSQVELVGAFIFVEQGTTNASTGWVQTTNGVITIGTTAIVWTQFSGAGTYLGTAGSITLTGNAFSIAATYVGQGSITTVGTISSGTWTGTTIAVANGGTAQTSAAGARGASGLGAATAPTGTGSNGEVTASNTGIPTKVIATIGDGSTTSILVTHNLGTTDVIVSIYAAATPFQEILVDVQHTSTNTVTLIFATAPTASQYKCAIIG